MRIFLSHFFLVKVYKEKTIRVCQDMIASSSISNVLVSTTILFLLSLPLSLSLVIDRDIRVLQYYFVRNKKTVC